MLRPSNRILVAALWLSSIAVGCGRREDIAVETERTSANSLGLTDVPCTKESCPQLPVYIDGPNGSTQIVANLEQENSMTFSAKAERGSTRQVKMRVYFGPEQCKNKWTGQDTAQVSCSWRPTDPTQSGKIKAIARDVSYCLEKLKQNPACQDMAKAIPDMDKELEFQYSVEDNAPQLIDPAFIENPGAQFGANGGLRGCGMGMLSGVVGVLQGSFMPAIMGCVTGYIGGLTQNSGTPSSGGSSILGGGAGSSTPPANGTAPSSNTGGVTGF
jgi:hypothetical protein